MLIERTMSCYRFNQWFTDSGPAYAINWWGYRSTIIAVQKLEEVGKRLSKTWHASLAWDAVVPSPDWHAKMTVLQITVIAYHCDGGLVTSVYLREKLGYTSRLRAL